MSACHTTVLAQMSALRSMEFRHTGDTLQLDSLAIWPQSLVVLHRGDTLAVTDFYFNAMRAQLYLRDMPLGEAVEVSYLTLPWKVGYVYQKY